MSYEYKIREVVRYVLTEYWSPEDGDNTTPQSRKICEFEHRPYAENMCSRLDEYSRLNEHYPSETLGKMPPQ